jgi:uncharacterized membrane protein
MAEWERWASGLAGGTLISYGLKIRGIEGLGLGLLGIALVKRASTGQCAIYEALNINTAEHHQNQPAFGVRHEQGIKVRKAITIGKPPEDVYDFFRDFKNLPKFMEHLESVTVEGKHSHWKARAPLGRFVEWDAEIINDKPGELIGWRSLAGSDVDSAGSVSFRRAPEDRGTEVHVSLSYQPPFGRVGAAVARLLGEAPQQQIEADLRRLKQLMETGEIPTVAGQSSGRGPDDDPATGRKERN